MTPSRWKQIEELYHATLEREPGERAAFLAQADPELRPEVESLLAQEGGATPLDHPAWEGAASLLESTVGVLTPGTQLGPYKIEGPLGSGGMGEVFRATDTRLGREVAIKTSREQFSARFEREARAISSLNNPHICTLYDVGPNYLVMELCEGETLAARLERGKLSIQETLRYGAQIADALAAAHARGITHRDIKPGNIMITGRAHVKVLDFGLAKRVAATEVDETRTLELLTAVGTLMGTPHYMAPEILQGKPADARSDLWALGVLLYHALTGSLPFNGTTSHQISSAILRDAPPPLPPQVPTDLGVIIKRLLAKQPGDRYQQAIEVRSALEAFQTSSATSLATTGSTSSRRNWISAAIAIAILAIGGFFALPRIQNLRAPASSVKLSDGSAPSKIAQANEYYERALLYGASGPHQDVLQERRMLERALEVDSKFAAAQAEQAFTSVIMILRGNSNDSSLLYKAEDEVRQALQNDPACGHAHSVLAITYLLRGRKELVSAEIDKILLTNPNDRTAYSWLIFMHQMNGDAAQALQVANRVSARWPLYWPGHAALGDLLEEQGDSAGAIREEGRVLEQDPKNVQALSFLAHNYMGSGELVKAHQVLERTAVEDLTNYRFRQYRSVLLALEGKRFEAAREMDADLQAYAALHFRGPLLAAEYYAAMGETSNALEWMDRAVRSGDDREDWFKRDSLLSSLQSNPRFQQIVASVAYRRSQRPTPGPETR
jgi:serine/threonine protein kinase